MAQIITEARVRIKDTSTTRQRYTDAQLTNIINEGQRDVVNNTWCIEKTLTFNTVAGTTYYALPTDYIVVNRITSNYLNTPETTLIQMDSLNGNTSWETQANRIPQAYFIDHSQPNNMDIGIYPYPQDNLSTTTIRMKYEAMVGDLVNPTDLAYSGEYHLQTYADLLTYYTAYRIYIIEGEADKATAYGQEYAARLKVMDANVGKKPNYNPSFSGPANSR